MCLGGADWTNYLFKAFKVSCYAFCGTFFACKELYKSSLIDWLVIFGLIHTALDISKPAA